MAVEQTKHEMAQLKWRCRRGMKELDMLLVRYADKYYLAAPKSEQKSFRALLSAPDPEILALLTGKSTTEDELLAHVIQRLLERDPA